MARSLLERRLSEASARARSLRDELAVVTEQAAALADTAEDLRLRALVSETPLAEREHQEAQRHADAMARHRADVAAELAKLERLQDELLERLVPPAQPVRPSDLA
jgi:predicted  nucleic acid-binding Zn-ribbon protein